MDRTDSPCSDAFLGLASQKTPSFRFPVSFFLPQTLHSGLQPFAADKVQERLQPFRLPILSCPLLGWGHPGGCWPFKPLIPTPNIFHLHPAPLPTAGSYGEPRGARRYGSGSEAPADEGTAVTTPYPHPQRSQQRDCRAPGVPVNH